MMWYKNGNRIGIREGFGQRRQIASFKAETKEKGTAVGARVCDALAASQIQEGHVTEWALEVMASG